MLVYRNLKLAVNEAKAWDKAVTEVSLEEFKVPRHPQAPDQGGAPPAPPIE